MNSFRDRVKIYYDAEFTGLHRNTTLLSIGFVSESGSYFYAEFNDYDDSQVSDWIRDNVVSGMLYNSQSTYHWISEFHNGNRRHMNIMMKDCHEKVAENLLSWLKSEYDAHDQKKIQFYTDCYAYDWVTLNDLICEDGNALNIPDMIDYIPLDLSTALFLRDYDPDVTREEFAGNDSLQIASGAYPFNQFSGTLKHNCLWDAYVSMVCWNKVFKGQPTTGLAQTK